VATAKALGMIPGAVSQWLSRARREGVAGLYECNTPGPKRRLMAEQRGRLPELIGHGAETYGLRGDTWTRKQVA